MLHSMPYNSLIKIIYIDKYKIFSKDHVYITKPELHDKMMILEDLLRLKGYKYINVLLFIDEDDMWLTDLIKIIKTKYT